MLNRSFLHTETELFNIPKSRLIMGLFAGLFFSFCFYAFMYLTREAFRFVSLTEDYDLWILTDKEVGFYNLFFAFVSVIFAQSICFSFWFDKPQNIFSKRKFQRILIGNDQSALNTYFLFWFSELAVIYGLTFGSTFIGGFYAFSFYPNYSYIFVLIILVLFLQTWNSIRRINKKQSLKWLFISMTVVSTIAFGLSKVNLIDYKSLNDIALQKNILFKYNLEVPESNCYESKLENCSLTKNIYVVRNKQHENSTPQIFIDNLEMTIKDLGRKIMEFQNSVNEFDVNLCVYNLHIDRTIKMGFVNELKNEMENISALKIAYAIVPTNAQYDKRFYKDYSLRVRLPNYNSENNSLLDIYKETTKFENIIEIGNNDSGEYRINGKPYLVENLKQTIKDKIKGNPNYIVRYFINDNIDFSVYFSVISKTKEAVNELRNEHAALTYLKKFDDLNDEEMNDAVEKYGFRIFEITKEMKKQLED